MADQLLAGIAPVFDSAGNIVAGGSVTFYQTGTTTLVTIYSNQAATTPMTNPVTLDAAGRAPQIFYTGSVAVKEVIKTAAGVEIDTIDPSPRFSTASSAADGVTASPRPSNTGVTVQEQLDNVSDALATFADTPVATVGGGTANAISLDSGKSLSSIATGQRLSFIGAMNNTGSMTVAVDGLTPVPIKTITGANTPAKYVRAGVLTEMHYDGAQWIADRIVERGSTTSGDWVRDADGALQITRAWVNTGIACTTANGALFRGNLSFADFPVPFIAVPVVQWNAGFSATVGGWLVRNGAPTPTSPCNGAVRILSATSVTEDVRQDMTATGKWY